MTTFIPILLLLVFSFLIFACGDTDHETKKNEISGLIQKGPFVMGSCIAMQEFNASLLPNSKVFETFSNDDFDSFLLPVSLDSDYVEVIASGFYYNEIKGKLSEKQLTPRAMADLTDSEQINVNKLATLASERINYLDVSLNQAVDPPGQGMISGSISKCRLIRRYFNYFYSKPNTL